jgi:hypothetical protein
MQDKEINLILTVKEIDQILAAISKLPLGEVIDLFSKIRGQAVPQLAAQEAPQTATEASNGAGGE